MPRKKSVAVANDDPVETIPREILEAEAVQLPAPDPVIATVGEVAELLKSVFYQLSDRFRQAGHVDPVSAAKEMLGTSYNVALLSINAEEASKPEQKQRLTGFNR